MQLTPIKMLESTSNTEGLPTSETGRELARLYKAAGGALTKEEYSKLIQYVKNTTKMRNKATKIVTLDDDDGNMPKVGDSDRSNKERGQETGRVRSPMTWSEASTVAGPSGLNKSRTPRF